MPKILITEDSQDLSDLLLLLLTMHNYEVATASDEKSVLQQVSTFKPDLILMDVMLHGADGRDLCRLIKDASPSIFIILLSASPELLTGYEDCRADGAIEKPFDINFILNRIKSLL